MGPCETDFKQQCQPDEEKNWERKLFYLLTPALMGDPFLTFSVFIRITACSLADPHSTSGLLRQGLRAFHCFHTRLDCYRLERKLLGGLGLLTLPRESCAFVTAHFSSLLMYISDVGGRKPMPARLRPQVDSGRRVCGVCGGPGVIGLLARSQLRCSGFEKILPMLLPLLRIHLAVLVGIIFFQQFGRNLLL